MPSPSDLLKVPSGIALAAELNHPLTKQQQKKTQKNLILGAFTLSSKHAKKCQTGA